jgi:hypothetical protein
VALTGHIPDRNVGQECTIWYRSYPEQNHAPPDLLRSHHELRAALITSGKRTWKLNFGRQDDPVLAVLRRVLREAREVARRFRTMRPPCP